MSRHESDPHLDMISAEPMPRIIPEPPGPEYRSLLLNRASSYLVTLGGRRMAIYLEGYYPSVRHVVAHLVAEFVAEVEDLSGEEHCDFAVWFDDTLLAAGHWRWDGRDGERPAAEQMRTAYFDDDGSDDIDFEDLPPIELSIPGWPTREQWEADGSDRIILRPPGDPAWDRPPVDPPPTLPFSSEPTGL